MEDKNPKKSPHANPNSSDISDLVMDKNAQIDFLNSILASSTEYSIVAEDLDSHIITWNEGAKRIYGYLPEEVMGKSALMLHDPEDVQSGKVESIISAVKNSGKWSGQLTRIKKSGEKFIAYVTFTLRRDRKGRPNGITFISRDITELRRLEAQHRELAQVNRRIQEANRLKSEFLANMSHELRTPLNGIIGFAELMHSGKVGAVSPEHKEYLGDILTSSRHLLQLINDVLDLSKVESGRMEFHPEPVNLFKIIGEVSDILRTLAIKKQIHLETHIDPAVANVILDQSKLKQVLYNFISNAFKFTQENGKIIIRALPDKVGKLRLEVEDTGIGVKKEDLHKLFVEFQQLDASVTKKYQGTGLGLALTRRIVEAQGGEVGVKSVYGEGSIFFIILPYQKIEATIQAVVSQSVSANKGNSILVIEDDPIDQSIIINALKKAGFLPETASSGEEALKLANKQQFDAITLDLSLPDMSGWSVLHSLRSTGLNLQTPVIVVTMVAEKAASMGFMIQDFLIKPVEPAELVVALEQAGIQSNGRLRTILIVDDDKHALKLARDVLKQNNYHVICTSDGKTGLDIVNQEHPDAIILDLMMPGMDGFEFLHQLRCTRLGKQMPVYVWTGKDLTDADYARLHSSAQAIVQKGDDIASTLITELQNAFAMKQKQTQS